MHGNDKLDPSSAKVPQGTVLGGRELAAFKAQKTHIDTVIAHGGEQEVAPVRTANRDTPSSVRGMR